MSSQPSTPSIGHLAITILLDPQHAQSVVSTIQSLDLPNLNMVRAQLTGPQGDVTMLVRKHRPPSNLLVGRKRFRVIDERAPLCDVTPAIPKSAVCGPSFAVEKVPVESPSTMLE